MISQGIKPIRNVKYFECIFLISDTKYFHFQPLVQIQVFLIKGKELIKIFVMATQCDLLVPEITS